jgi:putative transcriptional regulator
VTNTRSIIAVLAGILLFLAAFATGAQNIDKPMLLVAAPTLNGPYNHTAVIVIPIRDRHVGFILNRATEMTMGKLFPQHEPSAKVADPVYFGGPVGADALFALVKGDPGQPSIHLFGDIYATNASKHVDRIIETTPNDARYMVGFVGWQPDELAKELKSGFWFVGEPDESLVFRKNPTEMWDELVKRYGRLRPAAGQLETMATPEHTPG